MALFLATIAWLFVELKNIWGWPLCCAWVFATSWFFNLNDYLNYGHRPEFYLAINEALALGFVIRSLRLNESGWFFSVGVISAFASFYKFTGASPVITTLIWSLVCLGHDKYPQLKIMIHKGALSSFGFLLTISILYLSLPTSSFYSWIVFSNSQNQSSINIFYRFLTSIKHLEPLWGLLIASLPSPLILWHLYKENFRGIHERRLHFHLYSWIFLWTLISAMTHFFSPDQHDLHPIIIPAVTLCFYSVHLIKSFIGDKPKVLLYIFWICSSLFFAKYSILRQIIQFYHLDHPQESDLAYNNLNRWLQQHLKKGQIFCYWSESYKPYLISHQLCPLISNPAQLNHGEQNTKRIEEDLAQLKKRNDIEFLIENPLSSSMIIHSKASNKTPFSNRIINDYKQWKNNHFRPVKHDISPFLIFERR